MYKSTVINPLVDIGSKLIELAEKQEEISRDHLIGEMWMLTLEAHRLGGENNEHE